MLTSGGGLVILLCIFFYSILSLPLDVTTWIPPPIWTRSSEHGARLRVTMARFRIDLTRNCSNLKMDWSSLIDQVVTKDKDSTENGNSSALDECTTEDFDKPEGELTELEIAGLSCILEALALQLSILYARGVDSSSQSSKTSAKNLQDIIEKTMAQLGETGDFEYLTEMVREESARRKANSYVEKVNEEKERRIIQLQRQIRSNDKIKMRDVNKKQEIIAALKDEVQNLIARSELNMRYIDRRENARQGERLLRCENAEMELKWQLESLIDRFNNEIAVNDKICGYLCEQTLELEKELEEWKAKYETEMKNRRAKISNLQGRVREKQFRLQKLKQLYNDRQREMEEYLMFKEEKKAEEEREQFINECVTKIQAWWRGTMVRRGLGPYKKRKKAAKDKKKKKEK